MSDSQVELVNEIGKSFTPQTYTHQGTTIEAKAAYADEHRLHLYLSITAPVGTVLPDDISYSFYDYNAEDPEYPTGYLGGNAPYYACYNYITVTPLTDADPTDNQKDFEVVLVSQDKRKPDEGEPDVEPDTIFNDGYTKILSIQGIYQIVPDVKGDTDGYILLAPGKFKIDITTDHSLERIDLDVDGLRYGGVVSRSWTHDSPCVPGGCNDVLTGECEPETGLPIHRESYEYYVTAHSMSITSMGATWECEYVCDNPRMFFGLEFQVVMKDGSVVLPSYKNSGSSSSGTTVRGNPQFTEPINLEQIDYILIGDADVGETYKVYLPQR